MSTITSKVKYVQLGSSGLRISNPILGAMSFGDANWLLWCLEEAAALSILKSAYDSGITTWDTSNSYFNGMSERIIAKAIKTYQIPREKLVILTKCFHLVGGSCSTTVSYCSACTDSERTREQPNAEAAAKLERPMYKLGFTDMDQAIIGRVQQIAGKKGWSMAMVGLAWINSKIDAPIVGLGSGERVKEALEAAEKRLEPEEMAYLEELYELRAVLGH